MLNANAVKDAIARMSLLPFFPPERAWPDLAEFIGGLCNNDEQVEWLSRRAIQKWAKWEGPGALRELLSERYKPADDKPAAGEYQRLPTPHYREIQDGNGDVLGVQLLPGPAPRALLAAPETDARAELDQLVGKLTSEAKPVSHAMDLGPANPECTRCAGTGWLDASAGIRCHCMFRSRLRPLQPRHQDKIAELEGRLTELAEVDRRELARLEADLEVAKTAKRTKQEHAAAVAELEATLNYHDPKRGGGKHCETVAGAERFLVQ